MFTLLHRNKDNVVTREEFIVHKLIELGFVDIGVVDAASKQFDMLDKDKSGALTMQDIEDLEGQHKTILKSRSSGHTAGALHSNSKKAVVPINDQCIEEVEVFSSLDMEGPLHEDGGQKLADRMQQYVGDQSVAVGDHKQEEALSPRSWPLVSTGKQMSSSLEDMG